MKRVVKNAVALAAILALMATAGLFFGCPIKNTVGLPCPGCGMTRACLSLMKLDFAEAFRWHPLCFLVPALGAIFILKDTSPGKKFWGCAPLMAALAFILVGVYVLRMALLFPDTEPMSFEENALLVKFIRRFILH